jgi:hypothetical protein
MGGDNSESNLVLLTAREHYLAHYLLFLHYRDKQSSAAFHLMNISINSKYRDSRKYAELREFQSNKWAGEKNPAKRLEVRRKISERVSGSNNGMFGRTGALNPAFGMKHTDEFLRHKRLLHSNIVEVFKNGVLVNRFECTHDAGLHYKCTSANIIYRAKNGNAKSGTFKDLTIKLL